MSGVSFILDSLLVNIMGKKLSFWLSTAYLLCFGCGVVALSASSFPFGVLDGRC